MPDINDYINSTYKELPSELSARLLTAEEVLKVRELIQQDARTRWFWSSLRTWVLAISATIALFTVGLDGLKSILRKLVL